MLLIVTSLCVVTFLLLLNQSRMVIFGLLGGFSVSRGSMFHTLKLLMFGLKILPPSIIVTQNLVL